MFLNAKSAQQSVHPTLGILARFQAFFLRLIIFPVGRRSAARPSAGNANRWAAQSQSNKRNSKQHMSYDNIEKDFSLIMVSNFLRITEKPYE